MSWWDGEVIIWTPYWICNRHPLLENMCSNKLCVGILLRLVNSWHSLERQEQSPISNFPFFRFPSLQFKFIKTNLNFLLYVFQNLNFPIFKFSIVNVSIYPITNFKLYPSWFQISNFIISNLHFFKFHS